MRGLAWHGEQESEEVLREQEALLALWGGVAPDDRELRRAGLLVDEQVFRQTD